MLNDESAFPAGADPDLLGRRIGEARRRRGATQAYLAGTEFTRAYVSSIEAGKRRPSVRAARFLAERLGTELEDLCFGYAAGDFRSMAGELAQARIDLSHGRAEEAEQTFRTLLQVSDVHGDAGTGSRARCGLGLVARHRGDQVAAERWFTEALALLAGRPLAERVEGLIGLIGAVFAAGRIAESLALIDEGLREAAEERPRPETAEFILLAARALLRVETGAPAAAVSSAEQALALAPRVADTEALARGYYHLARALIEDGRHEQADRLLGLALALNEHLGLRTEAGVCLFAQGFLMARQDRLEEAQGAFRRAREVAEQTGALMRQANAGAELAEVLRRLGRTAEAAQELVGCRAVAAKVQDREQQAELDRLEARIAVDEGRSADAERAYQRALEGYDALGARFEVARTCRLLGDLQASAGRVEQAAQTYRRGLLATEHIPQE